MGECTIFWQLAPKTKTPSLLVPVPKFDKTKPGK
jgi:hypothetical protein